MRGQSVYTKNNHRQWIGDDRVHGGCLVVHAKRIRSNIGHQISLDNVTQYLILYGENDFGSVLRTLRTLSVWLSLLSTAFGVFVSVATL